MSKRMQMPGKMLLDILRSMLTERFSDRTKNVLNSWGITRWRDFQEIAGRMKRAKVSSFAFLEISDKDFQGRGTFDDVLPES